MGNWTVQRRTWESHSCVGSGYHKLLLLSPNACGNGFYDAFCWRHVLILQNSPRTLVWILHRSRRELTLSVRPRNIRDWHRRHFQTILDIPEPEGKWIGLLIALFVMFVVIYLNIKWTQQFMWTFIVGLALFNILLLCIFFIIAVQHADVCLWGVWNGDGSPGGEAQQICSDSTKGLGALLFPSGFEGFVYSIPAAIWQFIGIESVVMLGEEVKSPTMSVQKGIRAAFWTIFICAVPIIIVGTVVPPGAYTTSTSGFPLTAILSHIFSPRFARLFMAVFYLPCELSFLQTTLYVQSRSSFALSRAGAFPKFLSITDTTTRKPTRCLILAAILTVIVSLPLNSSASAYTLVVYMIDIAALLMYPTIALSYFVLRIRLSRLDRPYKSRAGLFGPAYVFVFCVFALITLCIYIEIYRQALYVLFACMAVGMILYALFRKHSQLWFSLEDEFIQRKLQEQATKDAEWRKAGLNVEALRSKRQLWPKAAEAMKGSTISPSSLPSPGLSAPPVIERFSSILSAASPIHSPLTSPHLSDLPTQTQSPMLPGFSTPDSTREMTVIIRTSHE